MIGNDQKSAWERHVGVGTINFGDLGCPRRYSGVLESDFHVDYHNPKVWMRFVFKENFQKSQTSQKGMRFLFYASLEAGSGI